MVDGMVAPVGLKRHLLRIGAPVALVAFVLDQISKQWVLSSVLPCLSGPSGPGCAVNSPMIEVTGFFNLVMVWNFGVSFGLFASGADLMPYILVLLSLVISGALIAWAWRSASSFQALSVGLVVGGAVGNIIDRLRFGAVADFLDFHLAGWHWPAFNVADCCIVVGVCLLLIDGLFAKPQTP